MHRRGRPEYPLAQARDTLQGASHATRPSSVESGCARQLEAVMHLRGSERQKEALEHQADEGDEMEASECLGQTFVIAGEATEAGCPREVALDNPPPGEEDEATFRLGVLDDFEADAVRSGVGGRLLA